jgi:hypothetical protein
VPPPPPAAAGGGVGRGGPLADSSTAGQHPADREVGTAGVPAAPADGGEEEPPIDTSTWELSSPDSAIFSYSIFVGYCAGSRRTKIRMLTPPTTMKLLAWTAPVVLQGRRAVSQWRPGMVSSRQGLRCSPPKMRVKE